jgi:protein SCO1/2
MSNAIQRDMFPQSAENEASLIETIVALLIFLVHVALILTLSLGAASCRSSVQQHLIAGRIMSIDRSKNLLVLSHGDIAGYMPAMIMPLKVKDSAQLNTLTKGDQITASLSVDSRESWLENIQISRRDREQSDERDEDIRMLPHAGEAVPGFSLVNQDGKKIALSDYAGKALLITFIYTRCPLPDYCPLMSSNLAAIDKSLRTNSDVYAKTHLLTVSFDPRHDTPAVLRSYGEAYTERYTDEKFDHWEFASGSEEQIKAITKFFGLNYSANAGAIVHSLVTAVIDANGKIHSIHTGNEWKTSDVVSELSELVR